MKKKFKILRIFESTNRFLSKKARKRFIPMMNIIRRFRKKQEKPVKIVFLGLDQAGKSTILAWLKGRGFTEPRRTLGMDVADGKEIEGFNVSGLDLSCWDIGGQESFRNLFWDQWGSNADACVFVIDSKDKSRYQLAIKEVYRAVSLFEKKAHLLLLMNKMDLLEEVKKEDFDINNVETQYTDENEELKVTNGNEILSIMDKTLIAKYLDDFVWELNMTPDFSELIQTVQIFGTSAKTGYGLNEAFEELFQRLLDHDIKPKGVKKKVKYEAPVKSQITKITNVYVIHKSGMTLLSAGVSTDEHDSMLLGGFLSAITDIAKKIFGSEKKTNFFPIGEYVIYSNQFEDLQIFVVAYEGINKRALSYVAKQTFEKIKELNIVIPKEGTIEITDEQSKQFSEQIIRLLTN